NIGPRSPETKQLPQPVTDCRKRVMFWLRLPALPVAPLARTFEFAGPDAAPGRAGGGLLAFEIAVGDGPSLHHLLPVEIHPVSRAIGKQTPILVGAPPVAGNGLVAGKCEQGLPRLSAAWIFAPVTGAGLAIFWRIDAPQAYALAVELDGIAVDDLRRTLL